MKRTLKYALTAVLGSVLVVPAMAQDNFPDVPDNHWAYEALARMKREGLLVGYPDGLYRGGRPASRYELAVAIHATYVNLRNLIDGLQRQIDEIKQGRDGSQAIDELRTALTALQNEVANMRGWGNDIADLRRLTETFQRELQALGVDVEAMKRDLADLNDRVTKLERRKLPVDISGDVNLWIGAGHADEDGIPGLTMDGRFNGIGDENGNEAGLTEDLTILHEAAITLASNNETGPRFRGTFVFTNMFGSGSVGDDVTFKQPFGDQVSIIPNVGYTEGPGDFYIQDLGVRFDTSIAGLGFNVEAGRIGYKVSPYIFQRYDNTSYFDNERWDNGDYAIDGAVLGFNFGGVKFDLIGGRTAKRLSINGVDIQPLQSGIIQTGAAGFTAPEEGRLDIDRIFGARLNIPLTTSGNVNLAYLLLLENNQLFIGGEEANRVDVYGGDVSFNLGGINLSGGFSRSDLKYNADTINDEDNNAWFVKAAYTGRNFGLFGKYESIQANYIAPGDWGRLGILRNPTNIRGFEVGGYIDLTGALKLTANAAFYEGLDDDFATGTVRGAFSEETNINRYSVGLDYRLSSNVGILLGFESTNFEDLAINGGVTGAAFFDDTRYNWYTVGLGYNLSDAAKLTIQYQMSDHRSGVLRRHSLQLVHGGTRL